MVPFIWAHLPWSCFYMHFVASNAFHESSLWLNKRGFPILQQNRTNFVCLYKHTVTFNNPCFWLSSYLYSAAMDDCDRTSLEWRNALCKYPWCKLHCTVLERRIWTYANTSQRALDASILANIYAYTNITCWSHAPRRRATSTVSLDPECQVPHLLPYFMLSRLSMTDWGFKKIYS